MAALPANLQEQFAVLRADEAANPTRSGQPNIFQSEGRDTHAGTRVSVAAGAHVENAVRRGVNPPNPETQLATQMSHEWIRQRLPGEQLTPAGINILRLVQTYRRSIVLNPAADAPYQRWIPLVTGRQLHKHQQSKGQLHETQVVLTIPNNILYR